jgi:hypothetical protein
VLVLKATRSMFRGMTLRHGFVWSLEIARFGGQDGRGRMFIEAFGNLRSLIIKNASDPERYNHASAT